MKKAISALAAAALLAAVSVAAAGEPSAGQAAGIKTASSLLDKLTGTFKHLAESGTGGRAALEQVMQGLVAEARAARAQKQLDPVFHYRFLRLMSIIQMAIVEDPQGILVPLFNREVGGFLEEVTGERPALPSHPGGGPGLAAIAGALAEEILNLRIYLDTLPRRAAMLQDFYKQFSPGSKE
jgi:hypothetical protein